MTNTLAGFEIRELSPLCYSVAFTDWPSYEDGYGVLAAMQALQEKTNASGYTYFFFIHAHWDIGNYRMTGRIDARPLMLNLWVNTHA